MSRLAAIVPTLFALVYVSNGQAPPQSKLSRVAPGPAWLCSGVLPVIDNLRRPEGENPELQMSPLQNWNDPSVLKDGSSYVMWASVGTQGGGKGVSIYRLTSMDGIAWKVANGGKPVLKPGGSGEFDSYGVETPVVIKANGKYHLYYTAYKNHDPLKGGNLFTMGHAVSSDGDQWTKLGELTSLTDVVGRREGNPWGWLARAEPAPLYKDGIFRLYFADVRCRRDDCGGQAAAIRGISLALSHDGHIFKQVGSGPVLLQTRSYPDTEGWEGYSTPSALLDGNDISLFVDVFRHVGNRRFQTRIARYRSRDGLAFEEVQRDVLTTEGHSWATMSVRAPSVIIDGKEFKMWFAGDNFDPDHRPGDMLRAIRSGELRMGIGMATAPHD